MVQYIFSHSELNSSAYDEEKIQILIDVLILERLKMLLSIKNLEPRVLRLKYKVLYMSLKSVNSWKFLYKFADFSAFHIMTSWFHIIRIEAAQLCNSTQASALILQLWLRQFQI